MGIYSWLAHQWIRLSGLHVNWYLIIIIFTLYLCCSSFWRLIYLQGWLFYSDSSFWKPLQMKVRASRVKEIPLSSISHIVQVLRQSSSCLTGTSTFCSIWEDDSAWSICRCQTNMEIIFSILWHSLYMVLCI